jgi:hypothetical protein
MSRRGGAGQNPFYDIDLEGFFYQFPAGLFQALKVGRCHMLIKRSLTFPCFVKIETSLWVLLIKFIQFTSRFGVRRS